MIEYLYVDDTQLHETANSSVTKFGGLGSPAPRQVVTDRSQRHGAVDETLFYGGRVFPLAGEVWGADAAMWAAWDAIKGALALGSTHKLRWKRKGFVEEEQAVVRVATELLFEIGGAATFVEWSVGVFAADPRLYGAALKSDSYDPTASLSGGGVSVPLVFPLVFSTTTVTQLIVTNLGQFPTPPVFTVTGPVVNPIVDNDTTIESIFVNYALGASDTVVVDVAARSCKLNGAPRPDLIDAKQTVWFELVKGTNRLRLRGTGMEATKTSLAVQFQDARI